MEVGLTPFMLEKSCSSTLGANDDDQVLISPNTTELFLKTLHDFYKKNKKISDKKLNKLLIQYHDQREKLLKRIQDERPIDMIYQFFQELGFRGVSRTEIYEFSKEAIVDIVEMKILYKNHQLDVQHTHFFNSIDKDRFLKKYSNFTPLLQVLEDTLKIYIEYDKRVLSTIDKKIETIAALIKFRKGPSN